METETRARRGRVEALGAGALLRDAVALAAKLKPDNSLAFLCTYFSNAGRLEQVVHREFSFVEACPHNRAVFLSAVAQSWSFTDKQQGVRESLANLETFVTFLCPSFPRSIFEAIEDLLPLIHPSASRSPPAGAQSSSASTPGSQGPPPAQQIDVLRAFIVYFYFREHIVHLLQLYDSDEGSRAELDGALGTELGEAKPQSAKHKTIALEHALEWTASSLPSSQTTTESNAATLPARPPSTPSLGPLHLSRIFAAQDGMANGLERHQFVSRVLSASFLKTWILHQSTRTWMPRDRTPELATLFAPTVFDSPPDQASRYSRQTKSKSKEKQKSQKRSKKSQELNPSAGAQAFPQGGGDPQLQELPASQPPASSTGGGGGK